MSNVSLIWFGDSVFHSIIYLCACLSCVLKVD